MELDFNSLIFNLLLFRPSKKKVKQYAHAHTAYSRSLRVKGGNFDQKLFCNGMNDKKKCQWHFLRKVKA